MQTAQMEFLVNQWKGADTIIELSDGKMSLTNLTKLYKELKTKDSTSKQELAEYMVLHNYVEKY